MRVRVDHGADAIYVNLTDRVIKDRADVADGIVVDYDAEGRIVGQRFAGCDGRARTSCGHLSRDSVLKAKMLNAGTGMWEVEHECARPTTSGMV